MHVYMCQSNAVVFVLQFNIIIGSCNIQLIRSGVIFSNSSFAIEIFKLHALPAGFKIGTFRVGFVQQLF